MNHCTTRKTCATSFLGLLGGQIDIRFNTACLILTECVGSADKIKRENGAGSESVSEKKRRKRKSSTPQHKEKTTDNWQSKLAEFPPIREKSDNFFQSGKSGENRWFTASIREKISKSGNIFKHDKKPQKG